MGGLRHQHRPPARPARRETPRRVAEVLRPHLAGAHGVSGVEITGPGFLNISLGSTASTALVEEILRRGPRYGFVEFVEFEGFVEGDGAGRDGPADRPVHLHAPHDPRALVLMEVIARLLRSQGTPVRTSCETRPEPEWTAALRIDVDAYGTPAALAPATPEAPASPATPTTPAPLDVDVDVDIRPVPAPTSPNSSPSAPTPPAGPCCTPPLTTGPGRPQTFLCRVRATPSSGSVTPTPAPGPSAVTPPTSASPPDPAT